MFLQEFATGQLIVLVVGLLAAGAVTGLLAGVFGVGGGAIIVPVLYELFRLQGVPEDVRMPLAVGTSLAIIIPTSIRSFRAHQRKGAVDMSILKAWALPVVLGVIGGSFVARYAPAGPVQDASSWSWPASAPSGCSSGAIPGSSATRCRAGSS